MKKAKKLISLLLSAAVSISAIGAFSVSAENTASLTENFDAVSDAASLNGQTVNGLTWAFADASTGATFEMEDHAGNGKAIRVNGKNTNNAELPLIQVYSGLDFDENAKELCLSLDVKLDKGAYYDLTLSNTDMTEAGALAKGTTPFLSFTRWETNFEDSRRGTDLAKYTENAWHSVAFKQQRLANGAFRKIWIIDGKPVKTVVNTTEYQFDKLVLSGGACNTNPVYTYNFAIDNVKFSSSNEYSDLQEKYSMEENFDSVASSADLNGKTIDGLTWAFADASTNATFEMEDHAGNGKAIRVNGTNTNNAELPLIQVYSGLDHDAVANELCVSLDVKLDKGAYYDLTLSNTDMTEAGALAKGNTPFLSFTRWETNFEDSRRGTDLAKYTENAWHSVAFKQQRLANGNFRKVWIIDGKPVKTVVNTTEYQFDKLVLSGGACNTNPVYTYNFAIDNVKFYASEELTAETWELKNAAQWPATSAATLTKTDVEAGYGKAKGDMAVELSGTGNCSPAIGIAPVAGTDVVVEYDFLINNPSPQFHLGFDWGSDTYSIKSGANLLFSRNLGLNQWNNFKWRAYYDTADSKYKYSFYINGVYMQTLTKGTQSDSSFVVDKAWIWPQQAGTFRVDNFKVSTIPTEKVISYCTKDVRKNVYIDWEGIGDGMAYCIGESVDLTTNYGTDAKASPYMNYVDVYNASSNTDTVTAPGYGKTADNNALKVGRAANSNAVNMRVTLDSNLDLIPDFQPGSTVRMGTSFMVGKNYFQRDIGTDVARINREIMLHTTSGDYANTSAPVIARLVVGPTGLMRYSVGSGALQIIANDIVGDKWYRVDYEIKIGDGETPNKVNVYVDGVKVNEEAVEIGTAAIKRSLLQVYVNHGSAKDAAYETDFYVDDMTLEYIPAGEEGSVIGAELTSSDDDVKVNNVGLITLLDDSTSKIDAAALAEKLTGEAAVIDAAGNAATGSAAGKYVKIERSGMPEIYYLAHELKVTVANGAVEAFLPYNGDTTSVMILLVYNADGTLAKTVTDGCGDDILNVKASLSEGQTYKLLMWEAYKTMVPYFAPVEG